MSLAEQGLVDEHGEASAVTLDWLLAIEDIVQAAAAEQQRKAERDMRRRVG